MHALLIPTGIPAVSRADGARQIPISREGVGLGAVACKKKSLPNKKWLHCVSPPFGVGGAGLSCLHCFHTGPSRR